MIAWAVLSGISCFLFSYYVGMLCVYSWNRISSDVLLTDCCCWINRFTLIRRRKTRQPYRICAICASDVEMGYRCHASQIDFTKDILISQCTSIISNQLPLVSHLYGASLLTEHRTPWMRHPMPFGKYACMQFLQENSIFYHLLIRSVCVLHRHCTTSNRIGWTTVATADAVPQSLHPCSSINNTYNIHTIKLADMNAGTSYIVVLYAHISHSWMSVNFWTFIGLLTFWRHFHYMFVEQFYDIYSFVQEYTESMESVPNAIFHVYQRMKRI